MAGSKFTDSASTVQLIGCIMRQPSLLNNDGKYFFSESDFTNEFHRVLFGAIFNLHTMGAQNINIKTIEDYLSKRPESLATYQSGKGAEWLTNAANTADVANFDYYYNRIKKMTLLRSYDDFGLDVKWIYDPDEIFDIKKKQQQENYLDGLTLNEIADLVDDKITGIRRTYIDNSTDEACAVGEDIFSLLEELQQTPDIGAPMYGSLINTVTRGMREKKFYLRSAATGVGKAIPNYTMIPTPKGYRKVEDIRPGDYLFGQDGQPTKVTAIHPQPSQKEVWKVTFADGRVAECCGEHLWEYCCETHRGYEYRVEDIQTIYERSLKLKNGLKNSDGCGYRFYIRMNQPVEYSEKKYYLSPYVMGALLGDGSFRYSDRNKSLEFFSADAEIPTLIANSLGNKYRARKSSEKKYSWTFRHEDNPTHSLGVEELLKDYPGLWNIKSEDKYIPEEYLCGSTNQRICLLQGLMDTGGSVDEKGRTSFVTISPRLRDNFIELCHGLGFCATCSIDARNQYAVDECYNIHIQAPKSVKARFFRLERKRLSAERYNQSNKREEYKDHLAIVNIERTAQLADMTCFTVDNNDHLFLMNDYIVTHNTRTMIADACYTACSRIYNKGTGEWDSCGLELPSLFISTELELSEVQTMCLAFLSGVDEGHILTNKYDIGERDRVMEAAKILQKAPLFIEEIPDFSLRDIENIIKRNIRTRGCKYVFYDYIHTSMKILEEISQRSGGVRLREDNILFLLSVKLKDICNEFGVFILSSTQLNGKKK